MMVSLLYAVILDLKRQSDTLMLRLDKVFQKIAGLDDYPVQSTISRFLKRFRVDTAKGIANVNHCLLMKARRDFEGWYKITLDLDSHVRTYNKGTMSRKKVSPCMPLASGIRFY
jgi:hypothetical protein